MGVRDPLSPEVVAAKLAERPEWQQVGSEITRIYPVDYDTAIAAVAEIGQAAVELEHRPDLDIRWSALTVTMTTHTAGDVLTELDFLLADRVDQIIARYR